MEVMKTVPKSLILLLAGICLLLFSGPVAVHGAGMPHGNGVDGGNTHVAWMTLSALSHDAGTVGDTVDIISMSDTPKKYCPPVVASNGSATINLVEIKLQTVPQTVHIYWYVGETSVYDYTRPISSSQDFHDPFSMMTAAQLAMFNSVGTHTAEVKVYSTSPTVQLLASDQKSYEIVSCTGSSLTLGSPSSYCLGHPPDNLPANFTGVGSGLTTAYWTDEMGTTMSTSIPQGSFNAMAYLPPTMITNIFYTQGFHFLRLDALLSPTSDIYVSDTVTFNVHPCVPPTITSFSPTSGTTGTSVVITGTNFIGTEVKFGGTPAASFHVDSSTQITAVVGAGSTGKVTVTTAGGTGTSSNEFTFIGTGTAITGTVTRDTDGQPVEGVQICAAPFTGGSGPCTTSLSNGTYTLTNVPSGYLRVQASGGGYLTEYYNNSYDFNWATAVWAAAGQTTPGINFSMGTNGSISGKVYKSDGVTPLANVCVYAYRHRCAGNAFASAQTDTNGNYTISNLPPQTYYLRTNAACSSPQHYQLEWWTSGGGTLICDQAGAVTVASGQNRSGINLSLDPLESRYPGPAITSCVVFSAHYADESIGTQFWARISGPSPEDVASFTVTGPAGTFNLGLLEPPFRQFSSSYIVSLSSVVPDGTYTFMLTDSLGRTTTVEKGFTYNSTIPQVDSATMKANGMGNQAYVGNTTPTLTWGAVTWPDAPGVYQVFVWDYDGKAIWYTETTEGTSITIPEGYLQPDTPYYWFVRSQDQGGNNRRYSNSLYFYTGTKGLPDLSHKVALSLVTPDYPANWFAAWNINLAPWDIHSFSVVGPNGTVYPYNSRSFYFRRPLMYACFCGGGPLPTPDGTYTFELSDNESNTDIQQQDLIYSPISSISEASRYPGPNAYRYARTTYSWDPVSDSRTLYYKVRIRDYNSQVIWYESTYSTETSWTYPDDLPAPPYGSYKWQILVSDDPTSPNNVTTSALRTITVPPQSQYPYTLPGGTGVSTDYRIFTIPLYAGTVKEFLAQMEKTLGSYNPKGRWRIFLYVDHAYHEINDSYIQSKPAIPGNAAWIISPDTTQVLFTGGTEPKRVYGLKLRNNSWSLVGLPWTDTPIDLAKIAVTDGIHTYFVTDPSNPLTGHIMWEYTGSGPDSGYIARGVNDTLTIGTGYFFKVLSQNDVTILFPPDNEGTYFSVDSGSGIHDRSLNREFKEEPPPPPGARPAPDIKANGQDGPIIVSSGTPVSVAVTLDPGNWAGREADWWVAAYAPFSWYTYMYPSGWRPGIHACVQTPLFEIATPIEVLNRPLPKGQYIFYFAVDGNVDGLADGTWMDSVNVQVE